MRSLRLVACASLLVAGLVLPGGTAAAADAAEFEVIVLRGASVARVSGGPDGSLREEILREDPRPTPRESATPPAPAASPEIVVIVDAGSPAPGYLLAAPLAWGPALHPKRHARRAVYRPGPAPPRYYQRRPWRHPGFPGGPKPR